MFSAKKINEILSSISSNNTSNYREDANKALHLVECLQNHYKWKPIETAPRDGTWFWGMFDGIPYKCRIVMNGDVPNYHWCMHSNTQGGDCYIRSKDYEGREVRTITYHARPPEYKPLTFGYRLGMNGVPTHWMPYIEMETK